MRLSRIKLAGFKSFVDPTTIPLPSNLVGVVGPNGCGKSNVIDAIRWVMGETSARNLRGDSMEDVIFNGSASRKPVGTASIELFFDNADGAIGGQYASYAEISIRRVVSRDGTSQYFLNNTRCRRKDITGLFLGTGLGPRSYAIIEQGMVSRLVEAKPEEMRTFVEEAAGISKYKERRRETETRMQHTRDNLARLGDLRDEVEKQIKHLQRQAQAAERYRRLKQDERQLEGELLAIRLVELDRALGQSRAELAARQTDYDAVLAGQREVEAAIEQARARHLEASESFASAQAAYYGVQSEISRLEQALEHGRELRARQRSDLEQALQQRTELTTEIGRDEAQARVLEAVLTEFEPAREAAGQRAAAAGQALAACERALADWQERWHDFTVQTNSHRQTREVEQTRLEHLLAHRDRLLRQLESVEGERSSIAVIDLEARLAAQQRLEVETLEALQAEAASLRAVDSSLLEQRQLEQTLGADIEQLRGDLESRRGRLDALRAVQRAALAGDATTVDEWLARHGIADSVRLVESLDVDPVWVQAVETVLGDFLQAVLVDNPAALLRDLPETSLVLLDGSPVAGIAPEDSLAGVVRNGGAVADLLGAVRCAGSIDEAQRIRRNLRPGESVITPEGVWFGPGWVRVSRGQRYAGAISREHEIRELAETVAEHDGRIAGLAGRRQAVRHQIQVLEQQRGDIQGRLAELNRRSTEAAAGLAGLRQDLERSRQRLVALGNDQDTVRGELEVIAGVIQDARGRLDEACRTLEALEQQRPGLQAEQATLLGELQRCRQEAETDRSAAARLIVEHETRRAGRDAALAALERLKVQQSQLAERITTLEAQIAAGDTPLQELQVQLDGQLARQVSVQLELNQRRQELEAVELGLKADEGRRAELQRRVAAQREAVDESRLQVREAEVRRESLAERFAATTLGLDEVIRGLPAEADAGEWESRLGRVRASIDRLGPINLAAIDEFAEQSARKTYLDAQFADLSSALETLETVIRKIDRETRTRFQETFDNINAGLKRIFPRLFGGGHAYLSLEGDEVLTAGVTVMARPPGKRNSHIHLLSGGEKALTAVALIFSIFELNPAPFCLLDEVDAPLDEANVGRFCEIVREMSKTVQFVVITHNKTTMEMTSQLTGVTMSEPGVSRLVAVDIDEAVRLAAS